MIFIFLSRIFEITYRYWVYMCTSTTETFTIGEMYVYKVLLQIVALVLAISIQDKGQMSQ